MRAGGGGGCGGWGGGNRSVCFCDCEFFFWGEACSRERVGEMGRLAKCSGSVSGDLTSFERAFVVRIVRLQGLRDDGDVVSPCEMYSIIRGRGGSSNPQRLDTGGPGFCVCLPRYSRAIHNPFNDFSLSPPPKDQHPPPSSGPTHPWRKNP
jgi:hypothetical protein